MNNIRPVAIEATQQPPKWCESMRPGHWYRLSGDSPDLELPPTPAGTRYLIDNDPARDARLNPARSAMEYLRRRLGREPNAPWRGRMGFAAITEAWNSAVYASRLGAHGSMVVFGGGHADYYGADVHAFDLATRGWTRISDGWLDGAAHEYGEGACYPDAHYPNGSPLPPHTYDYVQYDPIGNDYLVVKGQLELGKHVKAAAIPHIFNLTDLRWRAGARQPHAVLNSGGFSTWDERRRVVWVHSGDDGGGNTFTWFAPDGRSDDEMAGHWGTLHASKLLGIANHNAMQIDPVQDRIVVASHARNALGAIDPDEPGAPITWLASTAERATLRAYAALQYSHGGGHTVYCAPGDRGALYAIKLNGNDAHWRRLDAEDRTLDPFDDAVRSARYPVHADHLFGRLRIAAFDGADVAILVRHVDSPVYALRLGVVPQ